MSGNNSKDAPLDNFGYRKNGEQKSKFQASSLSENTDDSHLSLKYFSPTEFKENKSTQPEWMKTIKRPFKLKRVKGIDTKAPLDALANYYQLHKTHHVWTNNLVIPNNDVKIGKPRKKGDIFRDIRDLNKIEEMIKQKDGSESFLNEPEKHFYLKNVEHIGIGLFAKTKIIKGLLIYEILN